ncbi:MAG: cytidine deaminase [Deltaproteobacteria bacterium]|nr:cytidine deaminase [Deltaproteobacteria bacterium]
MKPGRPFVRTRVGGGRAQTSTNVPKLGICRRISYREFVPRSDEVEALLSAARDVRMNAYAPYSRFFVGAAVLTEDGRIFTGVNVENSSYPVGICAEVNALGSAVTAGAKGVVAVAVVTPPSSTGALGSPCGNCRQAIAELARPGCVVVLGSPDPDGTTETHTVAELLPHAFGPSSF